jgi:hypothetical protein
MQILMGVIGLLCSVSVGKIPAQAQDFRIGAAKRDITPTEPIRLSGYSSRSKPSDGIDQPIFARAIAVEDSTGVKNILVAVELVGVTRQFTESIADRLKTQRGIERNRFMIVASHTHNGPAVHGSLGGLLDLSPQEEAVIKRHTEKMADQVFEAASEALGKLEPARLTFGHGRATFAVNRRIFTPSGVNFGANPDGPADYDVPVLRAEALDGRPLTIVFGYACHATTLGGEYNLIGGDWPGFAQKFLEQAFPGVTALFITGCGADADPQPRRKADYVPQHGLEVAGAVASTLSRGMNPIHGPLHAALEQVTLEQATPPSREEFEKRLKDKDVFVQRHARRNLDKLDRGEKLIASYDSPVQVWRFGKDLTLVALGGEVVVDYTLRLKRELGSDRVWVAAYANDVFAYIPSARILIEGGYEADYSMMFYDFPTRWAMSVEETLITAARELVSKAGD